MKRKTYRRKRSARRGVIVVLTCAMMVLLIGMVAFAVDYGYIGKTRTDMQRTADAAALAAVQDIIPAADGFQDLNAARATVRALTVSNLSETGFKVEQADIQLGRYDPQDVYKHVRLLNDGIYDAVRVTLRRDGTSNPRLPLFFAQAIGVRDAEVSVTATAVLQKAKDLLPGAKILPFAVPLDEWEDVDADDEWSIYGDGKIYDDDGDSIPGNWGTVDIGAENNSTSDLNDQILNGLRQEDLNALHADRRIHASTHIDTGQNMWVQADTGLSSGLKHSVTKIHGQQRLIPMFDQSNGGVGNNAEFRVAGWGVVTVVNSHWGGNNKTWVKVQKTSMYAGALGPNPDLSSTQVFIPGAYTSPVLVE